VAAGGDAEQLVLYHEIERTHRNVDPVDVFEAIRAAVATRHELRVHAIVLLKPGRLPRTSSGKVRRLACRDAFVSGEDLGELARSIAPPVPAGADNADTDGADASADAGTSVAQSSVVPRNDGASPADPAGLERWLAAKLAAAVGVAVTEIDPGEPFARYGLDSASAVALASEIATELHLDLEATLFWDYPTVQALAGHLVTLRGPDGPHATKAA
jgi:acyl carrier protein